MGEEAEDSAGGSGSHRLPEPPPPPRVSLRCPGAGAPWGSAGGIIVVGKRFFWGRIILGKDERAGGECRGSHGGQCGGSRPGRAWPG